MLIDFPRVSQHMTGHIQNIGQPRLSPDSMMCLLDLFQTPRSMICYTYRPEPKHGQTPTDDNDKDTDQRQELWTNTFCEN